MEQVAAEHRELFYLLLSRFLYKTHNKPGLVEKVSSFWESEPTQTHNVLYVQDAVNTVEDHLRAFLSYIDDGKAYPGFTLQASPEALPGPEVTLTIRRDEAKVPDPNRIYMDGCFDLMHSGHFNAIRQAKALGKILVVGVHSDAEITLNKGPPVMNELERYEMVRNCKWVDEMIENAPYSPTEELLNRLNCMYAAHGDDCSINIDGEDAFGKLKRIGRCKIFKRTEGISTTNIVGKLLLMTKDQWEQVSTPTMAKDFQEDIRNSGRQMLTTTRRINIGHVEILKKAKELGDYLIVGVHDDSTVNHYKGSNFPIMALHERVLCVLAMKLVDEVIIGAPWVVSQDMITSLNVTFVVQGSVHKGDPLEAEKWRKGSVEVTDEDPYAVPKELGIYREIISPSRLDTTDIIQRIIDNRLKYISKYQRTAGKEENYYANQKVYVPEV